MFHRMTTLFGLTIAFTLCLTSCVSISDPMRYDSTLIQQEISSDLRIESVGTVHVFSFGLVDTDFMPSGLRIEFNSEIIYIDPVNIKRQEKADYIFISHAHADHFSPSDIQRLSGSRTTVICPEHLVAQIGTDRVVKAERGKALHFSTFTVLPVPAYNLKPISFGIYPHGDKDVGYLMTLGSTRLYFTGDTDKIPEMDSIVDVDGVVIPIPQNGAGLTIDLPTAAEYVNRTNAKFVIPVHYNLGEAGPQEFSKLISKNIRVIPLER